MAESSRINYQKLDKSIAPMYQYTKLTPTEGSSNVTVSTAGGQSTHFEIGSQAYNLSKTVLSFTYTCPALADMYNYIYRDCLSPVRQLQLYTREGQYLCNLQDVGNYTKMVWKSQTKLEKFLTFPSHSNGVGWGKIFQKNNVDNRVNITVASRFIADAASADNTVGNINSAIDTLRDDIKSWLSVPATAAYRHSTDYTVSTGANAGDLANVAYEEPQYFEVGAVATADPVINVKIDLAMIYDTIFAIDKTLYYGRPLVLRIVWNPSTKIYFRSLHTGSQGPAAATVSAATGDVTISNLNLFLAVEKNPDVINGLVQNAMIGTKILIPYVHYSKKSVQASTTQNISLRFDSNHGIKLQKIIHGVFHNTENSNTAYDLSNISAAGVAGGLKVATYSTTVNDTKRQQFDVNCANHEDYMMQESKLEGSVIQNANIFYYNHCITEDFTECTKIDELGGFKYNCMEGLDLSPSEIKWDLTMTTANSAFQHYSYAIVQRILDISPSGVYVQ